MAFPTRARYTTTNNSAATTQSVSIGSPASGDLVVIIASCASAATYSMPAGWTIMRQNVDRNTVIATGLFYKVCDGTEGANVTVTMSVASVIAARTYKISAGTFTGTPESAAHVQDFSTSCNPPSLTPTWGAQDTMWVAYSTLFPGGSPTVYPTDYTETGSAAGDNSDTSKCRVSWAERDRNIATEDPGPFTVDNLEQTAGTFAVQGTGGGGGPSAAALSRYRRHNLKGAR